MSANPIPELLEGALYDPNVPASFDPPNGLLLCSIAISLKRIADRLELVTTIFDGGGQINVGCEGNINVSNSH